MHNHLVFLVVGPLLLDAVKGRDWWYRKDEGEYAVKYTEKAFETWIVGVENYKALVSLEIDLQKFLESDGEKNAWDGDGHDIKWSTLQLIIEVAFEGKCHWGHWYKNGKVHNGILNLKTCYFE